MSVDLVINAGAFGRSFSDRIVLPALELGEVVVVVGALVSVCRNVAREVA